MFLESRSGLFARLVQTVGQRRGLFGGSREGRFRLGDEERVTEIAKMLSGSEITDAAVAQARILLGK